MIRTRWHFTCIYCLLFASYPTLAMAGSCENVTNIINSDITKYGESIQKQQLHWMKLSWLQQQLGPANTKNTINDATQYEWRCENSGFLVAKTDSHDNVMSVSGQYNSDDGSGLFEAQIPRNQSDVEFEEMISQLNTSPAPVLQPAPPPEPDETVKCKRLISQIRTDLSGSIQQKQLPWMNMGWLKQELGQPHTITTYDYVYKWPDYSLFIGADGSRAESGLLPKEIHPQTYADTIATLGRPKKTLFEKLILNTWECSPGNNSTLLILSSNKSLFTSISGEDCADGNCNTFSNALSGSALKQSFAQDIRQQAQKNAVILAAKLRSYNENYKTALRTQEELDIDASLKIKNYFTSLKQCRAGIYQYALPSLNEFLYHTAVINPQKDGQCRVTTSYIIPQIGKVDLKCHYQPQSLALFTNADVITAITNPNSTDEQRPSGLQKIIARECKRYIDGAL